MNKIPLVPADTRGTVPLRTSGAQSADGARQRMTEFRDLGRTADVYATGAPAVFGHMVYSIWLYRRLAGNGRLMAVEAAVAGGEPVERHAADAQRPLGA